MLGLGSRGFNASVSASFRTSRTAPGPWTSASRDRPAVDPWSGSAVLGSGNESGACWTSNTSFTDQQWLERENICFHWGVITFSCGGRRAPYGVPVIWASDAWSCRILLGCIPCRKTRHEGLKSLALLQMEPCHKKLALRYTCQGARQQKKLKLLSAAWGTNQNQMEKPWRARSLSWFWIKC